MSIVMPEITLESIEEELRCILNDGSENALTASKSTDTEEIIQCAMLDLILVKQYSEVHRLWCDISDKVHREPDNNSLPE